MMKFHRAATVRHGLLVALLVLGTAGASTLQAAQEAKLLPADGAGNDQFGRSVALQGDTAMVGAIFDDDNGENSGSVYVFTHLAGVWMQEDKLLPAVGQDFLLFGASMSLDGNTVLIGAWGDDQNGDHSGSAYVFLRVGGVWEEDTKLTPNDPEVDDYFGVSVALDGDTAVVGAWADDDNGSRSGSAYVFTRTAGLWTQQAKLLADDGAPFDRFGEAVALDGDTALIGARSNDENGDNAGAAYVFTRTAGLWTQQAKLLAADGMESDGFGAEVTVEDDTAVIGAPRYDPYGGAYVFTRTGTAWSEHTKLVADDGTVGNGFGWSIALDGDTTLVGALRDDGSSLNAGAVYVFVRNAGVWAQQTKLRATDASEGALFGSAIALEGDATVIGSLKDDDNGVDSGSAYVFRPLENSVVPALGRAGLALLLLTMLGAGAYFIRINLSS